MIQTPGMFITFEGIDGCGKTTQLDMLAAHLTEQGQPVTTTRNPGGTAIGTELRQILLHHPAPVDAHCELLLYMADRAQHMTEVVLPERQQGRLILCDRHMDSTVAYQGYGRGLDLAMINQLNQWAIQSCPPDLTFLFDGPVDSLLARVRQRGAADRLEQETVTFYTRVRDGYLHLAESHPQRFVVLDACQSMDKIHETVKSALHTRLNAVLKMEI